jgi:hypothetical protein
MIKEKGMEPSVFENAGRFEKEIVPEITQQVEGRVGYEEAHRVITTEELEEGAIYDVGVSLVDREINERIDEYIMAKREITRREYSAVNAAFIQENIGDSSVRLSTSANTLPH